MGFKPDAAPGPDPAIGKAAIMQGELAQQWLAFAKEAFGISAERQIEIDALTKRVTEFQLGQMERQGEISEADRKRYETVFRPLENKFIREAESYDTPEAQAEAAAKARGDVASAAATERSASERSMASYGISPASGRFAGVDRALGLGTGLAKVGAANNARTDVQNTGRLLRSAAIDMGRGLPASAAAASQIGLGAGSSAAGNAAGANAQYNGSLGIMNQGYSGAIQGYGAQANTLNNLYGNQLSAWNAQQQQNNASMAGWGQLFGTGVGLGLQFLSSKKLKKDRKDVPEGKSLEAVGDMPVETFRYKDGAYGLDPGKAHVGPMAEDFAKATGTGDGKTIAVQDAIGLAIGAVKDLGVKVARIEKAVGLGQPMRRAA